MLRSKSSSAGEPYVVPGMNEGQMHERKAPSPPYYLSGSFTGCVLDGRCACMGVTQIQGKMMTDLWEYLKNIKGKNKEERTL